MAIWDPNTNSYSEVGKADPRDRIDIEIGDSRDTSAFHPQVKIMRWDNEVNFSVRLANVLSGQENLDLSPDGTTITWTKGDYSAKFYAVEHSENCWNGGYEFEFILGRKPPTNTILFSMEVKNLEFIFQPLLQNVEADGSSWEELEPGWRRYRPANVGNSYAVYYTAHPKNIDGGKIYRTGKAFHIYRPEVRDSVGTKIWADINIANNVLTVTIPQAFLNKAVYPIYHGAGLTIGKTAIGGGYDTPLKDKFIASAAYSVADGGTLSGGKIAIWDPASQSAHVNVAMYTSNNTPYAFNAWPEALLTGSAMGSMTVTRTTAPTNDGELLASSAPDGTVAASTYYWMTIDHDATTNLRVAYDAVGQYSYWHVTLAYASFPPATAGEDWSASDAGYTIYYTYGAGGGATTLTPIYPRIKIRSMKPPAFFKFSEVVKYARTKTRSMISISSLRYTQAVKYARTKIRSMIPLSNLSYTMGVKIPRIKPRSTISLSSLRFTQTVKNARTKTRSMISQSSLRFTQIIKTAGVKIRSFIPTIPIGAIVLLTIANIGIKARTSVNRLMLNFSESVKTVGVKVRSGISQSSLRFIQVIKYARVKIQSSIPASSIVGGILLTVANLGLKIRHTVSMETFKMAVVPKITRVKIGITTPLTSTFEAFLIVVKYARIKVQTNVVSPILKFSLIVKSARVKTRISIASSLRFINTRIINAGLKLRAMPSRSIGKLLAYIRNAGIKARATMPAFRFRFTVGTKIARFRVSVPKTSSSIGGALWLGIKKFVTKAVSYLFSSGSDTARFDSKAEDYRFVAKND